MIQEAYVSFEVAKLLKEKGFDELCYQKYDSDGELSFNHVGYINSEKPCDDFYALSPTHQMAMAWLREKHNICITIYPDKENGYEAVLYNIKDDVEIILQSFGIYGSHIFEDSYEEAVEAALKYCLENLV